MTPQFLLFTLDESLKSEYSIFEVTELVMLSCIGTINAEKYDEHNHL